MSANQTDPMPRAWAGVNPPKSRDYMSPVKQPTIQTSLGQQTERHTNPLGILQAPTWPQTMITSRSVSPSQNSQTDTVQSIQDHFNFQYQQDKSTMFSTPHPITSLGAYFQHHHLPFPNQHLQSFGGLTPLSSDKSFGSSALQMSSMETSMQHQIQYMPAIFNGRTAYLPVSTSLPPIFTTPPSKSDGHQRQDEPITTCSSSPFTFDTKPSHTISTHPINNKRIKATLHQSPSPTMGESLSSSASVSSLESVKTVVNVKRKRKHETRDNDNGEQSPVARRTVQPPQCGLGGELRLHINFFSLGKVTQPVQTFGKSGYIIPDGLRGSHRMYSQDWQFQISYTKDLNTGVTLLTWEITNIASGVITTMTETPHQAEWRQSKGNTIANEALKRALTTKIVDLERELALPNRTPLQVANLESLIKELTPRKCAQGLLFFGLRHEAVQRAANTEMAALSHTSDTCSENLEP